MNDPDVEAVKNRMRFKRTIPKHRGLLSSGSTMLDIACSGSTRGAFKKGHIYLYVGKTQSGKTFFTLTSFAEAANNPLFDDYRLIHANPERGSLMDFQRFFGKKMADRVETTYPKTVEEFYFFLHDACKKEPFVCVLDSMDALSSVDEMDHFQKRKTAYGKNKEAPGSYGDGKARKNATDLRLIHSAIEESGSIVIIICHAKEKINQKFAFGDKDTKAGGLSLSFYATLEIWTSIAQNLTKDIGDKKYSIGKRIKLHVKKNRIFGRDRTVFVPIFNSVGIDNLGSMVDFLLEHGHWKAKSGKIMAPGILQADDRGLTKENLIHHIEERDKESELKRIVHNVWTGIEEELEIKRRNRYG